MISTTTTTMETLTAMMIRKNLEKLGFDV